MTTLCGKPVSSEQADRLRGNPREVDAMLEELVEVGWAWEGVMYCFSREKVVTDSIESRVVYGSVQLGSGPARPRLVVPSDVVQIFERWTRFDVRRIKTHLFAPDEWNEEEVGPALRAHGFWRLEHAEEIVRESEILR